MGGGRGSLHKLHENHITKHTCARDGSTGKNSHGINLTAFVQSLDPTERQKKGASTKLFPDLLVCFIEHQSLCARMHTHVIQVQ